MNAIGTQLRDLINTGLTRWRLTGIHKWTPPRKAGGISTRFSLSAENEQADAGRDSRTCFARPSSQEAPTGTGKYSFSLLSWPREGLAILPGTFNMPTSYQ